MVSHVNTPLVHIFGNSVLFGDRLDVLPMYFQPFLFYPDWFFMAWPFQLFASVLFPHDVHSYFASDNGPVVFIAGFFWFLIGLVLASWGVSNTFSQMIDIDTWPFPDKRGVDGFIFRVGNVIYALLYKFVLLLLFWHVIFARVISLFITVGGKIGDRPSTIIERVTMFIVLAPPLIFLAYAMVRIILYFL